MGKTENWLSVTNIILLVIVISFILEFSVPDYVDAFYFSFDIVLFEPWRLITRTFLHQDLLHLFLNVYAIFIFGNLLEEKIRSRELLKIFFLGGIAGLLGYLVSIAGGFETSAIVLGSSDSASALLGAAVFLVPEKDVNIFLIRMKVRTAAIVFIAYELLAIFGIFTLQANALHSAHVGGLIFGYVYALYRGLH